MQNCCINFCKYDEEQRLKVCSTEFKLPARGQCVCVCLPVCEGGRESVSKSNNKNTQVVNLLAAKRYFCLLFLFLLTSAFNAFGNRILTFF